MTMTWNEIMEMIDATGEHKDVLEMIEEGIIEIVDED